MGHRRRERRRERRRAARDAAKAQDPFLALYEAQRSIHARFAAIYATIAAAQRNNAARDVTRLVPGIPVTHEQVAHLIRPEDAARAFAPGVGPVTYSRAVTRDPVIAALVSKAAATKDAIAALAEAGFGADAYTLARTLLENVFTVRWLLHADAPTCELYCRVELR